ncbi:MAG TPA: TatD family hydrolase [Chitinivibrionales bacterium]
MWIDTHAHLFNLDLASLTDQLNACNTAGVERIINTGTSLCTSETVIEQNLTHPRLYAAVGISPFDTRNLPDAWDRRLMKLIRADCVIAVGEIGLDATNPAYPPQAAQLPVFERQLALAKEADLPVIMHCRGCESAVFDICKTYAIRNAVFHCYTGNIQTLKTIVDAGYYVSFSGIITFKNSPLTECVAYAPLERMLIETDSPYLAPVPHRGKNNQPAWAALVGEAVARIKKVGAETVAGILNKNFSALFAGNLH